MMPLARMDCANSSSRSASNVRRGWRGFGSMESMAMVWAFSTGAGVGGAVGGRVGSSAPSPLPSALRGFSVLFMIEDLFRELDVAFGAFRSGVVAQNRFPKAGSLRQPNASRDDGLK